MLVQNLGLVGVSTKHTEDIDELSLPEGTQLPPGEYLLRMDYTGKISTATNHGLYLAYSPRAEKRVVHGQPDAETVKNGQFVTHFEAAYARQVFPCFDEPCFKATFQVRLSLLYLGIVERPRQR